MKGLLTSVSSLATRLSSLFSPSSRTLICLALISFAASYSAIPYAIDTFSGNDDVNWALRSLSPWWFPHPRAAPPFWPSESRTHYHDQRWPDSLSRDYYYAIDHPSLARIVYRTVLLAAGTRHLNLDSWDYTLSFEENRLRGHNLPYDLKVLLRMTNFALFLAALIILFFTLHSLLRHRLLSLLALLPLAIEPTLARAELSVVTYIGADSLFLLLYVLFLASWLSPGPRGLKLAPHLGLIGGLASSTKINGLFLLAGASAYFLFFERSWRRLAAPLLTLVIAAAVFLALNPVYLSSDISWTLRSLKDTLDLRLYIRNSQFLNPESNFTKAETILAAFPYAYFLDLLVPIILSCRRKPWFPVLFFWSASLVVLNLAFIYTAVPRYAATVRVAFLTLFLTCAMTIIKDAFPLFAPHHSEGSK